MDWSAAAQFYKRLTHSYSSVLENKKLVCSGPSYQRILLVWTFLRFAFRKRPKEKSIKRFSMSKLLPQRIRFGKNTLIPFNCDIKIFPRVYSTYLIKHRGLSKKVLAFPKRSSFRGGVIPNQENTKEHIILNFRSPAFLARMKFILLLCHTK